MVYRSPRSKLRHTLALWGVLIAFCVSLASPIAASAAPSDSASSDDYMKAWEYATFLRACFNSHGKDNERRTISSPQNAIGYVWFNVNDVDVGYSVPTDNGIKQCGQMDHVREALATIGYPVDQAGAIKVLCGVMEYQTGSPSTTCSQDPAVFATQTSFEPKSISELNILAYRLYYPYFGINNVPPLRDEHKYVGYYNAFVKGPCKAQDQGLFNPQDVTMASLASQSGYAKIDVAVSGKTETHLFKYSDGTAILWTHERTFDKVSASCGDLGGLISSRAAVYAQRNPAKAAPDIAAGDMHSTQPGASTTSTCAIDGVGWIVCPVMNFLAKISDEAHKKLDSLMTIDAESIFNTEDKPGNVYSYWKAMRNYANIAFIIAFMVIIYSQITSAGISNYGIKKMLPKLIVVAMLVNVSFMICALAVDISNFLGVSLTNFISGVGPTGAAKSSEWATGASGFQNITGKVLVATAAGVVAYFALASVAGMLIFVVIASVTVLFILGLRQALIILLVVVSPLAFVAYLLPNTEGLFKKWWTMFKSLLLIYPIVGLLYGAGKLASGVLGNSDDILVQSVAGFLLFAPTLLAYILLKGVLNNFGSLGQMVGKFQGKTSGAANKKFQSKLGESTYGLNKDFRKRERMKSAALARGGQYSGGNLLRKGRSWIANKTNPMMGDFGRNLSNTGAGIASKEDDEDMKNAHARVTSTRHSDGSVLSQKDRMELAMGRDLKDKKTGKVLVSASDTHARRAAVEQAASVASVGELSQLVDASRNWEDASVRKSLASSIPQSSAGKKAPWLGGETIGDVEQGSASTAKAISKALLGGKITAETLASSDAATVTQLYDHALSTPPGSKERDILRQAEATLRGNNELAAKVASGGEHDSILSSMKSL